MRLTRRLHLVVAPAAALAALVSSLGGPAVRASGGEFLRGDSNSDGEIGLSDAVCTLEHLFHAVPGAPCAAPGCRLALDVDDDGELAITDPIRLLGFLFLGGPAPPQPFPACGPDPTPSPALDCLVPPPCGVADGVALVVPGGTELYSIWSEGFRRVEEQHAVLSVVRLRPGAHRVAAAGDTAGLVLIDALLFGPDLAPAEPLGPGGSTFAAGAFYSHEYTQGFRTSAGTWTFLLRLALAGGPAERPLDCAFLDGIGDGVFWAELARNDGTKTLHYSCFHPPTWMPASGSPYRLTLEDGTRIELEVEQSYLFRGVAGETANQRIARARVELRGRTLELEGHERLIYAALHHNAAQEYRLLFGEPVEGVHGIDVVTCPERGSDCTFFFVPEGVKAYLLDASLARRQELDVTAFERSQ
ncbi:MAG: hypothetical protein HY721_21355 [Planctomycetes bacterium]|nr:hypothetical protein [Planctomycetota bacterium]